MLASFPFWNRINPCRPPQPSLLKYRIFIYLPLHPNLARRVYLSVPRKLGWRQLQGRTRLPSSPKGVAPNCPLLPSLRSFFPASFPIAVMEPAQERVLFHPPSARQPHIPPENIDRLTFATAVWGSTSSAISLNQRVVRCARSPITQPERDLRSAFPSPNPLLPIPVSRTPTAHFLLTPSKEAA